MTMRAVLLGVALCASACAIDGAADEEVLAQDEALATSSPASVRVMTYNIKHAEESGLDLAKIAAVIGEARADIVGLQEVDMGTRRSDGQRQADELGALTGLGNVSFGASFPFDGGSYGVAILSRWPLANAETVRLDTHAKVEGGYEPRIAVVADVVANGRAFTFATLHASLHEEEHDGNASALLGALGTRARRAIVTGDFNERPEGVIGEALAGAGLIDAFHEKHRFFGYTIPSRFPTKRIDFVYRGAGLGRTEHAWVPSTQASDHRPVAAVVPL